MATRRSVAVGLAASALFLAAAAPEDSSARSFVENIYAFYTGDLSSEGMSLDTKAQVYRLFDPPLATLIMVDRQEAAKHDEPPVLDGDPFLDAQDWLVTDLTIEVNANGPNAATADVRFINLGRPARVRLALVRLPFGWRVHEITYDSTTLTEILNAK